MRYRDEANAADKPPWTAESLGNQSYAWLVFGADEVVLNLDLSRCIRARGFEEVSDE